MIPSSMNARFHGNRFPATQSSDRMSTQSHDSAG